METISLHAPDGALARITPHGAHVCSWIPAGGTEQLFLSRTFDFKAGAAIRGGVPIIFPQFASLGSLPKHGFARTAAWRLLRQGKDASGAAEAALELRESIATLTLWPYVFRAEFTVKVHGRELEMTLTIDNSGDTSFSFTSALHTYLAVQDIGAAEVLGLQGLGYRDSAKGGAAGRQEEAALRIEGELDRIYGQVPARLELQQPQGKLAIESRGFADAVVWNPGPAKGAALADLEQDGYRRMLCVEAGNILQPTTLAPGQSWSGSQRLVAK
jgi:glucose-6-phosphate 1-epimerase